MFTNWLRENKMAMWLLTALRLYLGYDWMTHGWKKLSAGGFDASGFINGAITKSTGEGATVQGWWGSFLEHFALPNVDLFNFLVPLGEFLVGVGLLLGCFTTFAAIMALVMNFAFLFSGTVSTNAQLVLLQIFIVVAGFNAAKVGLDYWVIPYVRKFFKKLTHPKDQHEEQITNEKSVV